MGQALSRILDPAALDACDKPRGRMVVELPPALAGAEIEVSIPGRVLCARCDGGGCDGCERRGGHRLPGPEDARRVRIVLPLKLETGMVLRVSRPLAWAAPGDDGKEVIIEQLHVETRLAAQASENIRVLALYEAMPTPKQSPRAPHSPHAPTLAQNPRNTLLIALFVIAIALTLGFLLLRR